MANHAALLYQSPKKVLSCVFCLVYLCFFTEEVLIKHIEAEKLQMQQISTVDHTQTYTQMSVAVIFSLGTTAH